MNDGPYILLYTGRKFFFDHPEQHQFDIRDIAHATAHKCRYSGHTHVHSSVAEHMWRASFLVPERLALAALLHDASEAYIADLPAPLKGWMREHGHTELLDLDKRIETAIANWYGIHLTADETGVLKIVDRKLAMTEARDLMAERDTNAYWHNDPPYDWRYLPMSAAEAESKYLRRFSQLTEIANDPA